MSLPPAARPPHVTPKNLGRYELIRVLGKGAMGVVYEGRDPNLDRRVAIKTVKVENLSADAAAEYEARFRTEARSAARLQHPNIVSVYDSDRDGDTAFLVMEFIQGEDLKHHLDRGVRYSLEQSLRIVRDLLGALDYAHRQGIVHRDIKPANLLLEPGGRLKLTDFGVARIQDSGEATRTQGAMVGTLKYMAPEQVQGLKVDARADLFSTGVVLYQLLTDKRPFDGDNDFSIIHQIIGQHPPAPSSFNPGLPPAIDAVVARALAKDREQRFATAGEFAAELQAAIRSAEDQTVVPPADPQRALDRAHSVPGNFTSPGATAPGTNSAVTQELELVYWKEIQDSEDAEDFHGFLERFPAGVYAELARRRLRRLARPGEGSDTRATVPGVPTPADVPRPRDGTLPRAAGDTVRTAAGMSPAYDPTLPVARTPVAEPPPPAPASPGPVAGPAQPAVKPPAGGGRALPAASSQQGRSRGWIWLAAGVAGVLVLAAAWMAGRGAPSQAAGSPQVPPPSTAAPTVVTAPPVQASTAPPQSVDAPAAASAQGAASQPGAAKVADNAAKAARAPAKGAKAAASAATSPEPPRAALVPPPKAEEPPAKPAPAVLAAGPSPVDQCKDKVFLARELCLAEHCAKPGTRSHPLCVRHREEVRLREEGRQRPVQ